MLWAIIIIFDLKICLELGLGKGEVEEQQEEEKEEEEGGEAKGEEKKQSGKYWVDWLLDSYNEEVLPEFLYF